MTVCVCVLAVPLRRRWSMGLRALGQLSLCLGCLSLGLPLQAQDVLLEEIQVVARKRLENAQQVGLSLQVMDGEEMRAMNLRSLPEVASFMANVEMFEDFSGASLPTWIIRGVGLQDFNTNNTPTAAVYVDDVYQAATVMGNVALFDTQQVTVLKGPQGGLYGRNTSGGAVLLQSNQARLGESSQRLSAAYSSWQTRELEGMINRPLGDRAAWRLAGRHLSSDSAWQRSLVTERPHGERDIWDLRSWLKWQPNQVWEIDWKLQGGQDRSQIPMGRAIGLYSAQGGFCGPALAGRRDQSQCLSWAGLNRALLGEPALDLSRETDNGSNVWSDPLNRQRNSYLSNTLIARARLDGVSFTSISALDRFDYGADLDLDGSAGEYAHRISLNSLRVASQEFRLQSDAEQSLQWLVGASYSDERFDEGRDFLFRDNRLVSQALGYDQGRLAYDQNTRSMALFASLDYSLRSDLAFNAALRYTREHKGYRNGFLASGAPDSRFVLYDGVSRDYALDQRWSGRVGLDWQWHEQVLLYAAVSHGFKTGGFYGGFPDVPEQLDPYREEEIRAYELGFKSDWQGGRLRLNGAVFHYDYRNVQGYVSQLNALTNTLIDVLTNQGDASHQGMEMELQWLPGEAWQVDLSAGYLDAHFREGGVFSRDVSGELWEIRGQRPFAPRWNGAARLHHYTRLGGGYRLSSSAGYHYRSALSGHLPTALDRAVNYLPGYGLLNARLALQPSQEHWELALWARNLADKSYRTRIKSDGLRGHMDMFGTPRAVGVSFDYQW